MISQTPQGWSDLMEQADVLVNQEQWPEALGVYQKILDAQEENVINDTLKASLWSNYAIVNGKLGHWEEALPYSKRSYEIYNDALGKYNLKTIQELYHIGNAYSALQVFDSLSYYWNETARRYEHVGGNHHDLALTYNNLSTNYYSQSRYYEAHEYILKAVDNWEEVANERPEFLAIGYDNLGSALDSEEGINYLKKGLNLKLELDINPFRSFVELGRKYQNLERYDEALSYLNKGLIWLEEAMELKDQNLQDLEYDLMNTYGILSSIYRDRKNHNQAVEHINKAIDIAHKHNYRIKKIQLPIQKASLLSSMGKDQEAIHLLKRIFKTEADSPLFGYLTNVLASIYANKQDFKNALIYNQFSVEYNQSYKSDRSPRNYIKAYSHDSMPITFNAATSLSNHAKYLNGYARQLSTDSLKKIEVLKIALSNINESILLFQNVQNFDSGSFYAKRKFNQAIDRQQEILFDLHELTNEQNYLEQAYLISETGKFNTTLLNFNNYRVKNLGTVPKDLVEKDRKLQESITRLKDKIYYYELYNDLSKDTVVNSDYDKLVHLQTEHRDLINLFKRDHPSYFKIKHDLEPTPIESIQNLVQNKTLILNYYIREESVFIYEISKNHFSATKLDNKKELVEQISLFRKQVEDPSGEVELLKKTGAALSDNLIPKNLQNHSFENVLIIPDKDLSTIPFEAFIRNDDYLIQDFNIHYAYSVTLWSQQKSLQRNRSTKLWVGFAPSYKTKKDQGKKFSLATRSKNNKEFDILSLPGTVKEVEQIQHILSGESFVNTQATKQKFKEIAPDYQLLHLAMHTFLDDEDPLFSKLLFENNSTLSESFLTISEIYSSQFNADLVVLSACNTGYGKMLPGEGVMSLSQAFMSAGCPSTVTTLWQIPDIKSTKLMVGFYEHLRNGDSKSVALRKSKLNYINTSKSAKASHPYFWAAYLLSGDAQPIQLKTTDQNNEYLVCLGIFFFVVLFLFLIKRYWKPKENRVT
ncbi:MAG: CHAT domain-containing tetratricopeptide repeat protein [Nonlabens sp.]